MDEIKEKIDDKKIENFCESKNILLYQCSAQENSGIELIFQDIAKNFLNNSNGNKALNSKGDGNNCCLII